jgi:uncharacterized protein YggE
MRTTPTTANTADTTDDTSKTNNSRRGTRILAGAGAIMLIAGTLSSCAGDITVETKEVGPSSGVVVQATGEAEMVPDAIRLSLTVSALAEESAAALNEASGVAAKVRAALEDNDISEKDIATQNISVNPEYSYTNEGQNLLGYRAYQGFEILIKKPSSAGKVVDDVVQAGGNNVTINSTYPVVEDTEQSLKEARKDAIEKARTKAEEYADLLGVELGDVVYLNETPGQYPMPIMSRAVGAEAPKNETVVDLGTQKVSVSVEIRWTLK